MRLISFRIPEDIFQALIKRQKQIQRSRSQTIVDLISEALRLNPEPFAEHFKSVVGEISELKTAISLSQRAMDHLPKMRLQIDDTNELIIAIVKSINSIEEFLEHLSNK